MSWNSVLKPLETNSTVNTVDSLPSVAPKVVGSMTSYRE